MFRNGWTYKDASLYKWVRDDTYDCWQAYFDREQPMTFNKKTDFVLEWWGMDNDVYHWVKGRDHVIYGIVYKATRSVYDIGHPVTVLRLPKETDRVLFKLFFHDWQPPE